MPTEDPDAAALPVMLPDEELVPDVEEDPAEAVGAGKTVERTPEPGAELEPDEGEATVADAVADGGCGAPAVGNGDMLARATSVGTELSAVSESGLLNEARLSLSLCVRGGLDRGCGIERAASAMMTATSSNATKPRENFWLFIFGSSYRSHQH